MPFGVLEGFRVGSGLRFFRMQASRFEYLRPARRPKAPGLKSLKRRHCGVVLCTVGLPCRNHQEKMHLLQLYWRLCATEIDARLNGILRTPGLKQAVDRSAYCQPSS